MIPLPPRRGFFLLLQHKPGPIVAWVVTLASLMIVAFLNLRIMGGFPVGIAFSLPLFWCLWTRNRLLLYLSAVTGSVLGFYKTVGLLHPTFLGDYPGHLVTWTFQLINIWLPALAVHICLYSFDRLDLKRQLLFEANEELDAANHELAAREQEVLKQNQALQSQAVELEQQALERRRQAETLEHQSIRLRAANDELTRRERGLQTLLESARWLRSNLSEHDVLSAICQAAVQVMEEGVIAAAIVCERDGHLALRGHHGFGIHGTLREATPFRSTFAFQVMHGRRTAFIADTLARTDVQLAQPATGGQFRSVLATPLAIDGRFLGAVEVYALQPRQWTQGEFKIIEWLAAQCSLALQAIEYQQEVLVKRREAEEASIQKTRFLAAISHDVRTPANAISLIADLIGQSLGDGAARPDADLAILVRDLKSSSRALADLVSDVLDLARLDTGQLDLQISDFSLAPLLENELRQFEHIAAEKKIRLTLQGLPGQIHLRTDRMKLARIVANLLGNAVKFTETGGVDLQVFLADGALRLRIADTGMGISAEALPRIFDEFYQIQNPERDRNKGAGLGLAICRRLVDALGCTLSVDSTVGRGTSFTICLPPAMVLAHAPSLPAPARNNNHDHQLNQIRILIVEDHDITRRAAARLLAAHGASIIEARTNREALQILAHDQPNVVLLDLMLPDGDGTSVLKQLQLYRSPSLSCVLAVSGDVRDARLSEVTRLGADGLLAKPLDIDQLLAAIASRLPRC